MHDLLITWWEWKQKLILAKEKEMNFRKEVCKILLPKGFGKAEHIDCKEPNLITYKVEQGVNRSIDKAALESIWDILTDKEKACIKYKPEISQAKALDIPKDSMLWDIITEKPATPALTRLEGE